MLELYSDEQDDASDFDYTVGGGRLYIYDSKNREVWQLDVRTGDESKLIEGKILYGYIMAASIIEYFRWMRLGECVYRMGRNKLFIAAKKISIWE